MKPAIIGFLFCAALAAQPASIEGTVINQTTGLPIAGVHVRLLTGVFGDSGEDPIVFGALSDPAGHFSVTNLKAGLYIVISERTGFVDVPSANRNMPVAMVPLKPGQQLTGYQIKMTPRATISGRVVDEYGDPVQHVGVELEAPPGSAQSGFFFGHGNNATDDRGEFHLVAAPGRYYLKATIYMNPQESNPEIRTDGSSAAPFASTYYPSAASTGGASIVQSAPGQDITGLEIRMMRDKAVRPAKNLTISGVVSGLPENAIGARVMLRSGDGSGQMNNNLSIDTQPDGKFSFHRQQPGAYRVSARYWSGKSHLQSQPVDLTLGESDETNLYLVLVPAEELTGTLVITGDAAPPVPAQKRTVRLEPTGDIFPGADRDAMKGDVDPDGAFHIADVPLGTFRPVVEPLPEDGYVESVMLDDAPVTDNMLDLSHGVKGARLKITVNRNGAQVSGTVLDKDGRQALVSPMVMIFLVSDPKQIKEMQDDDIHKAVDGKYTIKAIQPGKYRIFALDALTLFAAAPDMDTDNDELMKSFFNAAEEIEIKAGDRIVKDLKAIDKLPDKEPYAVH